MSGLIVSTLQLLSILGLGLGVLYFFKLSRRVTNVELILLAFPLGLGLNGWLLFLLGFFGQLNIISSLFFMAVGLSGFVFLCPRPQLVFRQNLNSFSYLLFGLLSYIFVIDLIEAITPPGDGDTLAYHFAFPKMLVEQNGLVFLPRAIDGAVPLLIQITYVPLLLLGGEVALTGWMFLTGWALIFITFFVALRYLSINWCLILTTILASTPIIVGVSGSGQVETRMSVFVLGACLAAILAIRNDSPSFFIVVGLLAGFLAGSKYYGLFFVLAIGVTIFLSRSWIKNGFIYVVFVMVAGFQWYLWNWTNTGDPFFPILYEFLGLKNTEFWSYSHNLERQKFTKYELPVNANLLWYLFYPFRATIYGLPQFDSERLGLGLYPLLILPFAIYGAFLGRKKLVTSELSVFAIVSFTFYSLWFFSETSQRVRHLLPILPLILICFTSVSCRVICTKKEFRSVFYGIALIVFFQLGIQSVASIKSFRYLFSGESREEYLLRTVNWYEPVKWMNKNLSKSDHVLSEMRWYSYILKPRHYYGHSHYQAQVNLLPNKIDFPLFVDQLKTLKITHVISWPSLDPKRSSRPLNFYLKSLSERGCIIPLKKFSFKYKASRTFWFNKNPDLVNTVLYRINLSNCLTT
tara:strand:- start:1936 stop:3837 length:1902 start_codon:yes stop_codon:yes gene_type:complete